MLRAKLTTLLHDDSGTTATEYALVATLIGVAAVSAFIGLGNRLGTTYENINTEVDAANG